MTETIHGMCHECKERTEWRIVHRHVSYHGITHCLQCKECGKTVLDFAWHRYQETEKVVIPV